MNTYDFSDERPWLDHYDPEVPPNLEYEEIALPTYLDRAAEKYPKRVAIVFRNWKITYADLKKAAEILAANLQAQGVQPGDRVAVMLPNLPQTVISFWAVLKARGIVVMTNPLYMEKELVHQITDSGAKYMIALDHLWPKLGKLQDQLPIKKYFITRIPDCLGFPLSKLYRFKAKKSNLNLDVPFDKERVLHWKPLMKKAKTPFLEPAEPVDPIEDLALLQYTGGTTGVSKGVMLSHRNLAVNVQQCTQILHSLGKREGAEVFMGILPYFHVYGLTVCVTFPTSLGATLAPFPRFTPKDVLEGINRTRPTVFPGAPSVYLALLQQKSLPKYDISSIKVCVSGSAPCPVEVFKKFKELADTQIVEGYGLTEASPVTHLNPLLGEKKLGSIGLPFPDTQCRVVDMEVGTVPLPPGKVGEMIIKGPQVMRGYWNRPDDTASSLRNGWLYTGDIARMDDEGYFFIVDRKKDMILTGGYNVYPREIDEVLHEHPKVAEAVAVGIPHRSRGEIIKAYIVPVKGETLTKTEIVAFCKEKLANYKVPKQVEFRDELPKSIVGKVLRKNLREEEAKKGGKASKTSPKLEAEPVQVEEDKGTTAQARAKAAESMILPKEVQEEQARANPAEEEKEEEKKTE